MAFQLSPGVNFSEIDLTNATAAVATTEGAIAGVFRWGPTNERTLITSEQQLVEVFGKPASVYKGSNNTGFWTNAETFYTASNFLGYSDALYVTRVVETLDPTGANQGAKAANSTAKFEGKYFGELGNSIEVSYCKGTTAGIEAFSGNTGGQYSGAAVVGVQGEKTLIVKGLASSADANALQPGDVLSLVDSNSDPLQDLTIVTSTPAAGAIIGSAQTQSFEAVAAPADMTPATPAVDLTDSGAHGVLEHDGSNLEQSSIIVLENAITTRAGNPIVFDGGLSDLPTGITAGVTYYVIPVSHESNNQDDADAANDVEIGDVIGNGVDVTASAIKLAATWADATSYDEDTESTLTNAIQLTASTGGASVTGDFSQYSQTQATITVKEKFAGLAGDYSFTKHWAIMLYLTLLQAVTTICTL